MRGRRDMDDRYDRYESAYGRDEIAYRRDEGYQERLARGRERERREPYVYRPSRLLDIQDDRFNHGIYPSPQRLDHHPPTPPEGAPERYHDEPYIRLIARTWMVLPTGYTVLPGQYFHLPLREGLGIVGTDAADQVPHEHYEPYRDHDDWLPGGDRDRRDRDRDRGDRDRDRRKDWN